MIGLSDAAFMLGVFMVWKLSGGVFVISQISLETNSPSTIIAFLLLLTAAITKAGALPLHTWLPTSGEHAPVSVMALLPAAIDKLLGIYLLVIVVRELFDIQKSAALMLVLSVIGAATLIVAVMVAMVQHNLKRLLSYHAVSQVGYMILGIATLTPVGIAGAVFHMLNNAIYKCCLFLSGGAVEQATGTADLDGLGGLGKKMPFTFLACLIAALSISGIPPFNGFVSKWMIYQGIIEMGEAGNGMVATLWPIWLTCAMFGSALTLASFVKIIHSIFLSRLPDKLKDTKEVSVLMTAPMIVLAAICVFFGVFYHLPLKHFIYPALGFEADMEISGIWMSELATVLLIVGIVLGLVIWFIAKMSKNVRTVPTWTCGETQSNESMRISGTHFYKTVSRMGGLKQLYSTQEKGYFDPYDQGGRLGLSLTAFLKWLHSGVLPMYLTWVVFGLLMIIFVICQVCRG
jgi:formate hydrogenlyase subunit 3/multisubunit Na+/H+ antiporter MnhD subunit